MNLRRLLGRRRLLQFQHRRPISLPDLGPVVSFTFDDFPRTAYTNGAAILRAMGVHGTFYTALGLMDSVNHSGEQFHHDDLYAVVADGHELATHTLHHVSSHTTALRAYVEEARAGRSALLEMPGLVVSKSFAYPFGAVTAGAKRAVGGHMGSCRSSFPGINGRHADLNMLRANALYGDVEQRTSAFDWLKKAEEGNGWLIFYTHDVRPVPSDYGCTPALLESIARMALGRSMRVLTVDQVLARALTRSSTQEPPTGSAKSMYRSG